MRPTLRLFVVLPLLALAVGGCSSLRRGAEMDAAARELRLVFQTHFHAQLVPCFLPCETVENVEKVGGIARRAAYVDSLRAAGDPLLLLDGGNFFAREERATDILSVVAWKEMERLRYDAATLGAREFENWDLVEYLLAESTLPLVTTNLEVLREGSWGPVGSPHLLVERGGLRVGILGLAARSEERDWVFRSRSPRLRRLPLAASAAAACAELADRADLIVALVAGDSPDVDSLASLVPAIDLLISGPGSCRVAGRLHGSGSGAGRSLGTCALSVSPGGEVLSVRCRSVRLTAAHGADSVIAADAERVFDLSRKMHREVEQEWERRRGTERR